MMARAMATRDFSPPDSCTPPPFPSCADSMTVMRMCMRKLQGWSHVSSRGDRSYGDSMAPHLLVAGLLRCIAVSVSICYDAEHCFAAWVYGTELGRSSQNQRIIWVGAMSAFHTTDFLLRECAFVA